MNRKDICKNIIQSIYEYITNPDKLEPHREKNHFIRKRKLSLYHVIMYLLFSSKASMFQNLARIRSELGTVDFPDISKQALSKARQFINPSLFKELYYLSVDLFYKLIPSRKLWNGYHLFAIDGSKIELPNSKSNFDFFGEMFGYPDPERRFTKKFYGVWHLVNGDEGIEVGGGDSCGLGFILRTLGTRHRCTHSVSLIK